MRQESEKPLRIGLLWHSFRNGNLGVGALSIANARVIERAAIGLNRPIELHAFGPDGPWNYDALSPIPLASFHRITLKSAVNPWSAGQRALAACDMVFDIGGGDSLTDIYGWKRYTMIVGSKVPPMVRGRQLALSPQTIGPFQGTLTKQLARSVIGRSAFVCSRDALSTAYAKKDLKLASLFEATDVAFDLPFTPPTERRTRPSFGLNVSGLLMQGGYSGENQFALKADYPSLVRRIIRHLLDRGDYDLHLVPHVLAPPTEKEAMPEDDHAANLLLASEFPEVIVAPAFSDPISAKTYIASLDSFAGSRMHATIAALSSGPPPLGLAYSRKFRGLYDTLGYDGNVDLMSTGADDVVQILDQFLDNRDAHRNKAEAARREAKRRLSIYEDAVRSALGEVA